jgi:hypothetical protein
MDCSHAKLGQVILGYFGFHRVRLGWLRLGWVGLRWAGFLAGQGM